ncbi:glutathione ABC transporter substrate-binding protein [Geomicrobium sp. JCM 19039]|uniref:glutathione ABC transporter substrate-binding protein n=1 Tax=Geomicrobium sp. JCM 19039 TaxID=1460636 RepID=UPI00045F38ED|nr:glutathione ABC transporter substrate-binding protein [Geomicrobium sp. JCM 19039]GAK12416.1 oligopeptide ABC transporter, periplasmic oligopeptide-binding protein OppA [Geomicrobium sp. JCM 19039]
MMKNWKIYMYLPMLAVLMVGCAGDDGEQDEEPEDSTSENGVEEVEGGDAVMAISSDPVDLDPHGSNDGPSTIVRSNIYENLVEQTSDLEIEPHLAQSYEQIDDVTWEFILREDVTFHDGEPFNAEAVKANIERAINPDVSNRLFLLDMIDRVEVMDEYTVHIITEYPFGALPANLAHDTGGMISPAAIEDEDNGDTNIATNPVGTGAFTFDSWDQGYEVVLTKNEDYWGEDAHLDSVAIRTVPEQGTRVGMLSTGEAQVSQSLEAANANQVEEMEEAELAVYPSLAMDYVGFNTQVEPFDDVRVRQAIALAIDHEAIVEGLFEGYGSVADSPINDRVFGYHEDLDAPEYDPERAAELLAEAGYEDGFETSIWTSDINSNYVFIAEIVQDQLTDIGINADVQIMEWATFLETTGNGDHEMQVAGWTTVTADADYGLYPLFHTDYQGAEGNRSFYSNDELDAMLESARQEIDEDERIAQYREIQEFLREELPMVSIAFQDNLFGVSSNFEGYDRRSNGKFLFKDAYFTDEEAGY